MHKYTSTVWCQLYQVARKDARFLFFKKVLGACCADRNQREKSQGQQAHCINFLNLTGAAIEAKGARS